MKRFMMTIILGGLTGATTARASDQSMTFECKSNSPAASVNLRGSFLEAANRHGEGQLEFSGAGTIGNLNFQIAENGDGKSFSIDDIDYSNAPSDSNHPSIQMDLRDVNYYSENVSTLTVNGHSATMSCGFSWTQPPACTNWCCHHNCR